MTVYRQNTNMEKVYVYASELRTFWHFHILKLQYFPSIFFVGTSNTVSETYLILGVK